MSLCPEAAERAAMNDGEFWEHVFNRHQPEVDFDAFPGWEFPTDDEVRIGLANPCAVCGSFTTCGYDDQGRPFVHCDGVDR